MSETERWADLVQVATELVTEMRATTPDPAILFRLGRRAREHVNALVPEDERQHWDVPWFRDTWGALAGHAYAVALVALGYARKQLDPELGSQPPLSDEGWILFMVDELDMVATTLRERDQERLRALVGGTAR